jgi:hypothetical protein
MSIDALTVERWVGEGLIKCAHIVLSSRIYRCSRTLPPRNKSNWVCHYSISNTLRHRDVCSICAVRTRPQNVTRIADDTKASNLPFLQVSALRVHDMYIIMLCEMCVSLGRISCYAVQA